MLNNSYNKNIFYSNLNFGGDFVDKVLDKLGLYDIVAVLLSGMVITKFIITRTGKERLRRLLTDSSPFRSARAKAYS